MPAASADSHGFNRFDPDFVYRYKQTPDLTVAQLEDAAVTIARRMVGGPTLTRGSVIERVALVSCVKAKRPSATAARDLYTSPLFLALRAYAIAHADAWYVLSAEHGLLRPDQVVAPYERTLNAMPKRDRVAWAERVQSQLLQVLPTGAEVILLAGERYREGLVPFLRAAGFSVTVPLEGLGIGKQLQRLKQSLVDGSDEQ